MKRIFTIMVILSMLFTSSIVFADSATEVNGVSSNRVITVGYDNDYKSDIFGNMSQEKIDTLLKEKIDELYLKSDSEIQQLVKTDNLYSKLIISISENGDLKSYSPQNLTEAKRTYTDSNTRAIDVIWKQYSYTVSFPLNGYDNQKVYGNYVTIVEGVFHSSDDDMDQDYIVGISTAYSSGKNFKYKDFDSQGSKCYNRFYFTNANFSYQLTGEFAVKNGGFIFYGVY